jgi:hypothetical protein
MFKMEPLLQWIMDGLDQLRDVFRPPRTHDNHNKRQSRKDVGQLRKDEGQCGGQSKRTKAKMDTAINITQERKQAKMKANQKR